MSAEPAILALDQGTTGSTALVVARDGRVVGRGYSEFTQHFPRPGWVEHDAEEIWRVTLRVARAALEEAGREVRVEAIGIANQRETVVLWDRATLAPACRAIVWQDRRTASVCAELRRGGHEARVRRRTGLVLDPYFSGTKLTWLLRAHPELRRAAEAGDLAAGTIDAWLVARLTGGAVHATDPTNASRTLLYDLRRRAWDASLADLLEVPVGILPEVRPSAGDFGIALGEHFGTEIPVAGVAGDQQAALFGQGCRRPGLAKVTYGTGAFLLLHTGDEVVPSENGLLTTLACDERGGPAYAVEGSIFSAGAAVQWLRDGLGVLGHASESEARAREVADNAGVYFVPAFVGLGAPHWIPEARGTVVGVTRGTTASHLVRAALESIAYGTAGVIRAMEEDAGLAAEELRADGGVARNRWLMQFQADILGVPVRRASQVETTALGAAGLAGIATGIWPDGEAFAASAGEPRVFAPAMDARRRKDLLAGWERAVGAACAWAANPGEVSETGAA